jgi:hypothetical protein
MENLKKIENIMKKGISNIEYRITNLEYRSEKWIKICDLFFIL